MTTKLLSIALLFTCLTPCYAALHYAYLMTHPQALEKAYQHCQQPLSQYCQAVMRAAADFQALMNERTENPEAFGEKILIAEIEQAKAEQAVQAAGRVASLEKLKKILAEKKQQVNILLAVVAAMSAE